MCFRPRAVHPSTRVEAGAACDRLSGGPAPERDPVRTSEMRDWIGASFDLRPVQLSSRLAVTHFVDQAPVLVIGGGGAGEVAGFQH
jgi:hypothetical protein